MELGIPIAVVHRGRCDGNVGVGKAAHEVGFPSATGAATDDARVEGEAREAPDLLLIAFDSHGLAYFVVVPSCRIWNS